MKQLAKLSLLILILLSMMCITGKVYAKPSCNIRLEVEKQENTIVAYVKMSDISSENGIITFQGTLKYEGLTLVEMKGENDWQTPLAGRSYNSKDGSIAIVKNGQAKQDEVIFSMTFTVNEGNNQKPRIELTNIIVADGGSDGVGDIKPVSKEITINDDSTGGDSGSGDDTEIPGGSENDGTGSGNNSGDSNGSGNNSGSGNGNDNNGGNVSGSGNGSGNNSGDSNGSSNNSGNNNSGDKNNSNGSNKVNDNDNGKDNVNTNVTLPQTGQGNEDIILLSCALVAVVGSIIFYIKWIS